MRPVAGGVLLVCVLSGCRFHANVCTSMSASIDHGPALPSAIQTLANAVILAHTAGTLDDPSTLRVLMFCYGPLTRGAWYAVLEDVPELSQPAWLSVVSPVLAGLQ